MEGCGGLGVNVSGVSSEVFCEGKGDCERDCALSLDKQICVDVSDVVEVVFVVTVGVILVVADLFNFSIDASVVFGSEFVGVNVRISHVKSIPFLGVFWQVVSERALPIKHVRSIE